MLCTYTVTNDTGLAPNPFWGWCTLAVCTPNYQSTRLQKGDWIAGFLAKSRGQKLLYLMRIDEVLDLDDYYRDHRFARKRPNVRGDWRERVGDNFYYKDSNGKWQQAKTLMHREPKKFKQDTKRHQAFVGRRFRYLGRNAMDVPERFAGYVQSRGIRYIDKEDRISDLVSWVENAVFRRVAGTPNDNEWLTTKKKSGMTTNCGPTPASRRC